MVYVRLNLSVNMYNMSTPTTTTTNQRMLWLNPVWESAMWTQPCMGVDWRFGLNPVWESAYSTLYGSLLNQPCMGACANRRRRIRMNASNSQTANPIRLSSGPQCPSSQTAGDCDTNANCCQPRCQATSQTVNDCCTKPPAPHNWRLILQLFCCHW